MTQKKLRVLTISKPYVAAAYRQKLRYLAEDPRFEIGLITPKDWAGQAFETAPNENYWIRTLDIRLNGKNHFHSYRDLAKAMNEFKPDIVNIEEEHYSLVTLQVMREAKRLGAKSVFYTWQNIDKSYPFPFSAIESYVFRNSAHGIAGNQEALDILRKKGFKAPGTIIPQMGADADAITAIEGRDVFRAGIREKLGINEETLLLVFAGRFVEEKGIQDVIHALALLRSEGRSIHLMLMGGGPYKDELTAIAAEAGVSERVHFMGSVPSFEIYKYFAVADAMVLSSHTRPNWKEQFGRVLIEGMLSGVVPIGSDSGEIPLVIAEAGLVHKEKDAHALARCIDTLDQDRKELKRLADAGRARASEYFTNRIIAKKFGDVFLSMAGLSAH